jgi:glutamyl-tRNA reductase
VSASLLCMSLSRTTVEHSIENIWEAMPNIIDTVEDQETAEKVKAALKVLAEELLWELPKCLDDEEEEDEKEEWEEAEVCAKRIANLTTEALRQRMGQAATMEDAENLRSLLAESYPDTECVEDIPEVVWLDMLNRSTQSQSTMEP